MTIVQASRTSAPATKRHRRRKINVFFIAGLLFGLKQAKYISYLM
jgi:hypothetical protein